MIRKSILLMLAVVAVVAGAAAFMLTRHEPEWTTDSPQALAELESGLEADQKFYRADAVKHYERALQMDPDFFFAKMRLLEGAPKEKAKTIVEDLRSVDRAKLNDRERFYLDLILARLEGDSAKASQLIDAYVDEHPEDAWGLWVRCSRYWDSRDFTKARQCYERLLKVAPNWVVAQNNLGYLEMAQGRFAEAENAFRTYRYIAPDQANPHDSLGELLTLVGRYDEAERELRESLRVRPDFCASWDHLTDLALLRGDYSKAKQVAVDRAKVAGCGSDMKSATAAARISMWQMADSRRAEEILKMPLESLPSKSNDVRVIRHAAAVLAGNFAEAERIERAEAEAYAGHMEKRVGDRFSPTTAYLQARRLAKQGDHKTAIDLLRKADAAMVYWGSGDGVFKLVIKGLLADTLTASGDSASGEAQRREIDGVNPHISSRFEGSLLPLE